MKIKAQFSGVEIDQFVVMPNHLHGILVLPDGDETGAAAERGLRQRGRPQGSAPTNDDPVGAPLVGARARLGDVVGAFKSRATTGYIGGVKANGWPYSAAGSGSVTIMSTSSATKTR